MRKQSPQPKRLVRTRPIGNQYDVFVQLAPENRSTPQALSTIFLRNPSGEMILLWNVASVAESVAPKELKRFNQLRSVTIQGSLAPGATVAEAMESHAADTGERPV